jgi:predicted nucleic acid-binding protein
MKLALDTNIIVDFLKQTPGAVDPLALIEEHECFVSVITKLELLKYPDITPAEEETIAACPNLQFWESNLRFMGKSGP